MFIFLIIALSSIALCQKGSPKRDIYYGFPSLFYYDSILDSILNVNAVHPLPVLLFNTSVITTSTHDSTTFVDTCRFQIKQWKGSAALTYTSGYIVDTNQNVGGSFFALTAARYNGGGGYITAIEMGSDTANTTGATFDILIFKDTTSFGASLPANNTQYTTIFDMGKFYVGHEYVTLAAYGTTGGARGYTTTLIPFKCLATSKNLYYLIIANGAYKPGYNAIYRLRVYYERN